MATHTPITAEYARSRIDYDPETGILTWKARPVRNRIDKMWNTRFANTAIAHKNSTGHIQFGLDGRNHLGHRIAWLIVHGECPPLVDHENRIRDDNRLLNLRAATRSQNNTNTRVYSNNTSGFRGVSRRSSRNKWSAHIRHAGKTLHLGNFNCITAAALAYDAAARKFHGEFASLNFKETSIG
ncbi:HNH endonuclease [Mesorhizobium sp. BR1-1-7]|uniref:HNH endonuclease n=1 Tax=Mesorhizobium sp. BR1-1-7 TaxID=2876647 RepID=UPI001CC9A336|nr:HNH endonuclease [Mesorhizobium sp. BR1-1-7]MBZ9922276.1 HNH endonuclease [Mesorhizobium sp. BR1-1-7]